jgi:DNA mismatch repair protein MutL
MPLRLSVPVPGAAWPAAPLRLIEPAADAPELAPRAPLRPAPIGDTAADAGTAGFFGSLRPIGQVFDGYLVCEGADQLVLIDQHAAHERVTFERLRAATASGLVPRQQLLVPAVVELGPREAALLAEQVGTLDGVGFEIEPYAGGAFAVRAVPALLGDADPVALLRDLAEDLADIGKSRRLDEATDAVLARLACHSAVRVGHSMGPQQVRALLNAMDRVDFAGNCPHGRPAYVVLSRGELERWFRRT